VAGPHWKRGGSDGPAGEGDGGGVGTLSFDNISPFSDGGEDGGGGGEGGGEGENIFDPDSVLAGTFVINNNSASVTLITRLDYFVEPEGNETFTFSLPGTDPLQSVQVTIIDVNALYSLTPSSTSIFEGQTVTINIDTANVPNGTSLSYQVTGIGVDDLGSSLTGTVNINNNSGSISFTPPINFVPQGSEVTETFTFTLNPGTGAATSVNITVNAVARTYALSISVNPVNEGSTPIATLTTNLSNGQLVNYTITGTNVTTSDLGLDSLTGNFVVSDGSSTLVFNIAADLTTEGPETVYIRLTNNPSTVVTFVINDTSVPVDSGDFIDTSGTADTGGTSATGDTSVGGSDTGDITGGVDSSVDSSGDTSVGGSDTGDISGGDGGGAPADSDGIDADGTASDADSDSAGDGDGEGE
jgi:hypothetical protein